MTTWPKHPVILELVEVAGSVFACGRDPFFPAWPDVLQLNAFDPGLRGAVVQTILDVATQCDGIRCDMAMLVCASAVGGPTTRPASNCWRGVGVASSGAPSSS